MEHLYMKKILNILKQDKIIVLTYSTATFFAVINLLYILFFFSKLPPFLPLFNQFPWGEKRVGTKTEIFIPLIIVGIVFLSNFFIAGTLYQKMPLVSRILCVTTLLISFFAFLFAIRTIALVL